MARAVLRHAYRKRLRVVGMTHYPDGMALANDLIKETAMEFDDAAVGFVKLDDAVEVSAVPYAPESGFSLPEGLVESGRAKVNVGARSAENFLGVTPGWSHEFHEAVAQLGVGSWTVAKLDGQRFLVLVYARTPTLAYGEDYCFLGQRAGAGILIITMGQSLYAAFPTDYSGKLTRELPMLKDVPKLGQIDYLLTLSTGSTAEIWVAYGSERYKFPMGVGCTAVMAPDLYPYYQSKQITGILGGIKGAWEYETLIDTPGSATQAVPSQTAAHMLVILLVLICNVGYFATRGKPSVQA